MPALQTLGFAYNWPTVEICSLAMTGIFFKHLRQSISGFVDALNIAYLTEAKRRVSAFSQFGKSTAQLIFIGQTDGVPLQCALYSSVWCRLMGTNSSCTCDGLWTLLGK
jgi:hypothetical protein